MWVGGGSIASAVPAVETGGVPVAGLLDIGVMKLLALMSFFEDDQICALSIVPFALEWAWRK